MVPAMVAAVRPQLGVQGSMAFYLRVFGFRMLSSRVSLPKPGTRRRGLCPGLAIRDFRDSSLQVYMCKGGGVSLALSNVGITC